jgi:hypothetical protein
MIRDGGLHAAPDGGECTSAPGEMMKLGGQEQQESAVRGQVKTRQDRTGQDKTRQDGRGR